MTEVRPGPPKQEPRLRTIRLKLAGSLLALTAGMAALVIAVVVVHSTLS
jgi:hypothetical protein